MAKSKIVWIIGGGSGIGAAVARLMAQRGWIVAISGRRVERLAEVAEGQKTIHPYRLDVTDQPAIEATIAEIVAAHGRIDLAIFGAATWQPMALGDYDFEKFHKVVDTNLLGAVRLASPLIRQFEAQGGGEFAVIASVAGYFGLPRSAAYGSTKAALIQFCQTMRTELAPRNIGVRLIAPGFVKSELTAKNDFPMPFLLETDDAARRIVDGLTGSRRFEIAFPRRLVWPMKLMRMLPYPLFFWLAAKTMPKAGPPR